MKDQRFLGEDSFEDTLKLSCTPSHLYKPQKIILFGSLMRGNPKPGTDIDFFIIKKNVPNLGVDRIRQLDRLIKYK